MNDNDNYAQWFIWRSKTRTVHSESILHSGFGTEFQNKANKFIFLELLHI